MTLTIPVMTGCNSNSLFLETTEKSRSSFLLDRRVSDQFHASIEVGPILAFRGQKPKRHLWPVSMMIAVKARDDSFKYPKVTLGGNSRQTVEPEVLGQAGDKLFLRYSFPIIQGECSQKVPYQVNNREYSFQVPAIGEAAHWGYFSCNGYQSIQDKESVDGIQPMWHKFNEEHAKFPFHFMIGGGDQIYSDGIIDEKSIGGVFALPSIKDWLDIPDDNERNNFPFTAKMHKEVYHFYLNHYCRQFIEPEFKEALASIPTMMSWDDHDIFDGFGTYPPELQNSDVFQGIFSIALAFYSLFQQQTTIEKIEELEPLGKNGYTFLRYIDEGEVALLELDCRSERTQYQVISDESWKSIFNELENLPSGCKHLIVLSTVPVLYPDPKALVNLLKAADDSEILKWILEKIPGMKNQFRLWELADDAGDGWSHSNHQEERDLLIEKLQALAERRGVRVTFFGGDIHTGGASMVIDPNTALSQEEDPKVIWQVISSGIGNVPPPAIVLDVLRCAGLQGEAFTDHTLMKLILLQEEEKNEEEPSTLFHHRNFATIIQNKKSSVLEVKLHVEKDWKPGQPHGDLKIYRLSIPIIKQANPFKRLWTWATTPVHQGVA